MFLFLSVLVTSSFSQEFQEGKRHEKHHLARGHKLLTSHKEELQKDLSSPVDSNPPSISLPLTSPMPHYGIHSCPMMHNPSSHKLSYNTAIKDGQIASSGGTSRFRLIRITISHQGLSHYNGRYYQISHHQPSHFQMRSYQQQSCMTNSQDEC